MTSNRRPAQGMQQQAIASKPIDLGGSGWSEWALHNSGLYYYRARYVSYEDISAIPPTGRNSIVPNIQGGYIHYESMTVSEALSHSAPNQVPELSTCSTATTPTNSDPTAPSQGYAQPNNQLVLSTAYPKLGMEMSGALQSEEEAMETVVVISSSNTVKRVSTTSKRQKDKKRHGKKLDVDKRKQISNKAKVDKWLDALG